MFLKDIEKFKKTVESTMKAFFNYTPEEVEEDIARIEGIYSKKYNLDVVEFKNVDSNTKEVILRYRTLKYFDSVYKKTMELYEFLKSGEVNEHK